MPSSRSSSVWRYPERKKPTRWSILLCKINSDVGTICIDDITFVCKSYSSACRSKRRQQLHGLLPSPRYRAIWYHSSSIEIWVSNTSTITIPVEGFSGEVLSASPSNLGKCFRGDLQQREKIKQSPINIATETAWHFAGKVTILVHLLKFFVMAHRHKHIPVYVVEEFYPGETSRF